MAEWSWKSFHPGQTPQPDVIKKEAEKLMKRCDLDGDGVIGEEEFDKWYG